MPYGDIGGNMNKARLGEPGRGVIPKLDVRPLFSEVGLIVDLLSAGNDLSVDR